MPHYDRYGLRKKTAGYFSAQISSRITCQGYRKVCLRDYKILGNEMVPYFEFDKLKNIKKNKDMKTMKREQNKACLDLPSGSNLRDTGAKRVLFTLLIAALMAPAGLMAQRLYKDGSGRIILDMTVAAGMPADAVTNVAKYDATYMSGKTPANSSTLADNTHTGSINATVYEKLEIAPQDMAGSDGSPALAATGTTMRWVSAFNRCRNLPYDGGGWRLPTQRELQMMWIFKQGIENFGSVFNSTNYYWCATEAISVDAWYVSFGNGVTSGNVKTTNTRVRCVREVTP